MFESILVAIDGSDTADRALDVAADLARRYGASLDIVHVRMHGRPLEEFERMARAEHIVAHIAPKALPDPVPSATTIGDLMSHVEHEARVVAEIADRLLDGAADTARAAGVETVRVHSLGGDYADAILDAAEENGVDLIVMGRRGLGRVKRLLVGSVSNKVVQQSERAVLLIH